MVGNFALSDLEKLSNNRWRNNKLNELGSTLELSDQEINEAVARKLGNFKDGWYSYINNGIGISANEPPDYCHDIKAAWEIMLYVDKNGSNFDVGTNQHAWYVKSNGQTVCESNTAPMAICLAFLKLDDPAQKT